MLSTTFRQTREIIGEWRRRARSRRELAMLGQFDRHDLACRFDLNAELHKPFWQAEFGYVLPSTLLASILEPRFGITGRET